MLNQKWFWIRTPHAISIVVSPHCRITTVLTTFPSLHSISPLTCAFFEIHYTCFDENGKKLESTHDGGPAPTIRLGGGDVLKALEKAFTGMAAGERITVCDAQGTDYTCVLTDFLPDRVLARVESSQPTETEPPQTS